VKTTTDRKLYSEGLGMMDLDERLLVFLPSQATLEAQQPADRVADQQGGSKRLPESHGPPGNGQQVTSADGRVRLEATESWLRSLRESGVTP
jgi:hypothetical protein